MDLPNEVSLCYEIHGEPGKYFNFISESCLSVNAHYLEYDPIKPLNFIDQIAIVATNSDGYNTNMTIDRHCNLYIDGPRRFFNYSGIMAEAAPGHVVVVIDNSYCGGEEIVLVVECAPDQHGLIQLHVTRDPAVQNGKLSHGLLGQYTYIIPSFSYIWVCIQVSVLAVSLKKNITANLHDNENALVLNTCM